MKKLFKRPILMEAFYVNVNAQIDTVKLQNTIAILPNDSKATIIAKAAHVVPTVNQPNALQNEFIAFVHIGQHLYAA